MALHAKEVRDAELRGNVPARLLQLIDAVAQADGVAWSGPSLCWRLRSSGVFMPPL